MVKAGQEATSAPYVSIGTYGDFETDLSYQVNGSRLPISTLYTPRPQHFLNFLPLPHGHGSFRPTFGISRK